MKKNSKRTIALRFYLNEMNTEHTWFLKRCVFLEKQKFELLIKRRKCSGAAESSRKVRKTVFLLASGQTQSERHGGPALLVSRHLNSLCQKDTKVGELKAPMNTSSRR